MHQLSPAEQRLCVHILRSFHFHAGWIPYRTAETLQIRSYGRDAGLGSKLDIEAQQRPAFCRGREKQYDPGASNSTAHGGGRGEVQEETRRPE